MCRHYASGSDEREAAAPPGVWAARRSAGSPGPAMTPDCLIVMLCCLMRALLSSRPRRTGAFCRCFLHLQLALVVTVRMPLQRISLYIRYFQLSGTCLTGCTSKKYSSIGVKHSRSYVCLGQFSWIRYITTYNEGHLSRDRCRLAAEGRLMSQ